MILIGSIQRYELETLLERKLETELSNTCASPIVLDSTATVHRSTPVMGDMSENVSKKNHNNYYQTYNLILWSFIHNGVFV